MKPVISPREWETLSAYLDGQLSESRKAAFDRELAARPELDLALRELQKLKLILHSVPLRKVRRNFMVKPGAVKPARLPVLVPVFRTVSAIAGVAVVALLAVDFLPRFAFGAMAPKAAAPVSLEMAAAADNAAVAEAAPQIVYWGGQAANPTLLPLGLGGGGPGYGGGGAEGSGMIGGGAPDTIYLPTATPMSPPSIILVAPEATQSPETFTKSDQYTQPTAQATSEPAALATQAPAEAPATISRAADTGPILGIAPTEQQGTFTYTERTLAEHPAAAATLPVTRILEIALGTLAVALGIAALVMRKKA